jgi:hypothetical protein
MVEPSEKVTGNGAHPLTGFAVNWALGRGFTITLFIVESMQPLEL